MTTLDHLARWRADPVCFIEDVLHDPETNKPFKLFPAQRQFFAHAWHLDDAGRLLYPDQCFSAPKKSGKTATASLHLLTTTILFGGRFAEGYALANDLEQAQGRVFQAVKRICQASPLLKRECNITQSRIELPQTGAVIQALDSGYAGASGSNPTISSFDELWAFTSERSHRLWDEMVVPPTRKIACRLVTTYAGFENESSLLQTLYKRGLQQPQIGPDLYAGDGVLMFWSHTPVAPWQDERWLADMRRSLRPNQYLRMVENRWVSSESSFISMSAWDRCVDPGLSPVMAKEGLPIFVGVDASHKHDSTAICATTWDKKAQQVRLVFHRVFQPSPDEPLDFEVTVERTILDLRSRFQLRKCLFDPWQMQASAQRLAKAGVRIEEFPQSPANLTGASQNLFDLIQTQGIVLYPDEQMRLAASRAVAKETPRGWKISKELASHKIDLIIALGLAAHAAVQSQGQSTYVSDLSWVSGPIITEEEANRDFLNARMERHIAQHAHAAGRRWI